MSPRVVSSACAACRRRCSADTVWPSSSPCSVAARSSVAVACSGSASGALLVSASRITWPLSPCASSLSLCNSWSALSCFLSFSSASCSVFASASQVTRRSRSCALLSLTAANNCASFSSVSCNACLSSSRVARSSRCQQLRFERRLEILFDQPDPEGLCGRAEPVLQLRRAHGEIRCAGGGGGAVLLGGGVASFSSASTR